MTIESDLSAIRATLEEIDMKLGIGLGLLQSGGGGGAAFNPADVSGLVGWWDVQDLSTLWQDTGATTPAGVGDPVRRIDDKSGNGLHMTTAGTPLLFQDAGGKYYVFASSGNYSTVANAGPGVTSLVGADYTVISALRYDQFTAQTSIVSADSVTNARRFGFQSANYNKIYIFDRSDSTILLESDILTNFQNENFVAVAQHYSGGKKLRFNGSDVGSHAVTTNTPAVDGTPIDLFYRFGRMYGAAVYNAAIDAGDLASLETYFGTSCGISI